MYERHGFAVAVLAGAALALSACGGTDTCQHGVDAYSSLQGKVGSCQVTVASFDKQACSDGLESCSDQEKSGLNAFFDCMQSMDSCQAGQEDAFMSAYGTCEEKVVGVSSACITGVFGQ